MAGFLHKYISWRIKSLRYSVAVVQREEVSPLLRYLEPPVVTFFELGGDTVWGTTGAILHPLIAVATRIECGTSREI